MSRRAISTRRPAARCSAFSQSARPRSHRHPDHARHQRRRHRAAHLLDERRQAPGGGRRMSVLRTFETGLRGLLGHRLRSILTTLGILFGVAAVICTVGIGQASADSVAARIAALGTNLLTVTPGSTVSSGVLGGAGSAETLTMSDVSGLQSKPNAPDIEAVAPVVQASASM